MKKNEKKAAARVKIVYTIEDGLAILVFMHIFIGILQEQSSVWEKDVMNGQLSTKLRGVSFLGALMIILFHAEISGWYDQGHVFAWDVIQFTHSISKAAVPLFFAISGFLFAYQYDNGKTFLELTKRRLNTLGKPYIYWSLIYTAKLALLTVLGNYLAGRQLNSGTDFVLPLYSWKNPVLILGLDLSAFPIYFPLWYIRNLFLLFLIFVPLRKILKSRIGGGIFLGVVAICCIMRSADWISGPWRLFIETGFSLNGLLCFSAGVYFKFYPVSGGKNFRTAVMSCLLWILLAWPWHLPSGIGFALNNLSVLIGSAAIWRIYDHLPGRAKLETWPILHHSFFIYAAHYIVMSILFGRKVCLLINRMARDGGLLLYAAQFIVTAAAVIVLAYLLERFVPKLYRALSGGR